MTQSEENNSNGVLQISNKLSNDNTTSPSTFNLQTQRKSPPEISTSKAESKAEVFSKKKFLGTISEYITNGLEIFFENHGRRVASRPKTIILVCCVTTILFSFGFTNFHNEIRPFKLWLSQNSDFMRVLNWQTENFPIPYRQHVVIWVAENVLTANAIQEMWKIHLKISNMQENSYGKTWEDVCARIPSLIPPKSDDDIDMEEDWNFRRKRSIEFEDDFSLLLDRSMFCEAMETFPFICFETSLLEVWGLNEMLIMNLTDQQVIDDVNNASISKIFGFPTNFRSYLGGITLNDKGIIISANAARHTWITNINNSAIRDGLGTFDTGTGFRVDLMGMSFEKEWLNAILENGNINAMLKAIPNAASSFGRVSDDNINGDLIWVTLGFILMLAFSTFTIGKRNFIEQRTLLSMAGIFGITQATIISFGICSICGIFYSPVNSILPILMVGLGVDDMFVIMSSWEKVIKSHENINLVERTALTMRHAGVAITVTSLTDVCAFAIGATTALPALKSFCLYASVGILLVYIMQITFFLSVLICDEMRIEQRRADIFPCIKIKDWKPSSCSERNLLDSFFKNIYSNYLLCNWGRILVLTLSFAILASSIWASLQLSQHFDPMSFLPTHSYLYKWHGAEKEHYPLQGDKAFLYLGNVTFPEEIPQIQDLLDQLIQSSYVLETSPIFTNFIQYYNKHPNFENKSLSADSFYDCLSLFLSSKSGAMYRNDFQFEQLLNCSDLAPPIKAIRLSMRLERIENATEQFIASSNIKDIIDKSNISGFRASWAESYIVWETNAIVGKELQTNVILVLVIVFLITLLLLASLWAALLVITCVAATIASICGLIWLWGLHIDTVTCICIVLSVGLSVDYAVHVAHAFLSLKPMKNIKSREKARMAVTLVGPAVLQGGLSTLIAFLMMAPSSSYVFLTFFKVFSGSATFGLFWGLVALPVILSFTDEISKQTSLGFVIPRPHQRKSVVLFDNSRKKTAKVTFCLIYPMDCQILLGVNSQ